MLLIQLFLPLYDNENNSLPPELFSRTRDEMVERFGGLTTYSRSPAGGLWQEPGGRQVCDDLIVYEVMMDVLDEDWWGNYRRTLEERFRQKALVVRAQEIRLL